MSIKIQTILTAFNYFFNYISETLDLESIADKMITN